MCLVPVPKTALVLIAIREGLYAYMKREIQDKGGQGGVPSSRKKSINHCITTVYYRQRRRVTDNYRSIHILFICVH